jgi:hypothetical protein
MLTGKQQSIFQPLKESAWLAYCERNPLCDAKHAASQNDWYRKVLVTELGVFTTKEIPGNDQVKFDALCLVFATIGGDQAQIEYWASAAERRALWLLKKTMENAGVDSAYVRGIARNMHMGDRPLEDLPAELILKLNTAVFIYMKRKQKKSESCRAAACSEPCPSAPEDPALTFP